MPTPTTQSEAVATLQTVTAQLTQNATDIQALQDNVNSLNADMAGMKTSLATANTDTATAQAALKQAKADLAAAVTKNNALLVQVAELQSQATASDALTAELQVEFTALMAKVSSISAMLGTATPPPPPPPVTPPTDDVIAERLGKSYAEYDHSGEVPFPDQYLRPVIATPAGSYRSHTSEGLGTWSTDAGDYSSTAGQVAYVPDDALVIDKTGANWSANAGIGLARLTLENMSNGSLGIYPEAENVPMSYVGEWIQHNQQDETTIGHPIGIARGYGRWTNGGIILFSNGFVSVDGTATSTYLCLRFQLPTTKTPTAIGVTSGNEFTLITCIDKASGKGQLAVYANYTGKRLQTEAGISPFYHDWPQPHAGLPSVGTFEGAQLLGFVDLGINAPSGISAVASRTSDRINAADGNAGTMGDKDLSIQATRDEFSTGNNSNYISSSGFAVVISKTENKAVYVDMRAMFAGYKTQYTTTQALYDATVPPAGATYWAEYKDSTWPARFDAKPEWTPTVTATVSVPSPTSVLISEHGDGALAVGCEDGMIRFWTGGPADSSTPVAAGSVQVGRNITCLTYDKFPSQNGTRLGGFFAVSRGDRSVSLLNTWGGGSAVTKTLRDGRLIDPVQAEVSDTHGVDVGVLTVCDFAGKQVLNYRYTDATLVNYGNQVFPIQGGADWECTGVLSLPGKPFVVSGTNVN